MTVNNHKRTLPLIERLCFLRLWRLLENKF